MDKIRQYEGIRKKHIPNRILTFTFRFQYHHRLYIIIYSPISIMFFLVLPHCRILSKFTFILSFRKIKYQIRSYITFNMDDSKRSIHMKTYLFAYFSINGLFFFRFFGKTNIFKYFSTCQTRSFDFWIMNAMCTFIYIFVVYFSFASVISASIHRYVNYFNI